MTYEQLQLAVYRLITPPDIYYDLYNEWADIYGEDPTEWVKRKVESGELKLP